MNTAHDFKAAVLTIQKLNPSAAVFARAHQLIASKKAELEELNNIIKHDSALTAELIRLSNSGAIGISVPTASLTEAMARVGLGEVDRYLGLSLSKSVLNRNLECYGITAYEYWSCSVSTAILMELLAKQTNQDKGEAYTLGILHAIGRLVINQVLEEMRMSIYWDGTTPIETWELESVGFTYTTAGALLLKGWGFPASTADLIENQLTPGKVTGPSPLLKLLNFSIHLILATGPGFTGPALTLPDSHPFLKEFHLSPPKIQEIVDTAKAKYGETVIALGITK